MNQLNQLHMPLECGPGLFALFINREIPRRIALWTNDDGNNTPVTGARVSNAEPPTYLGVIPSLYPRPQAPSKIPWWIWPIYFLFFWSFKKSRLNTKRDFTEFENQETQQWDRSRAATQPATQSPGASDYDLDEGQTSVDHSLDFAFEDTEVEGPTSTN